MPGRTGGAEISVPRPRRGNAVSMPAMTRELLSSLPAAVAYLAGPDLVVEFANEAYRRLVGGRDVVGLPAHQALPECAAQAGIEILGQVMETGQPVRGHENGAEVHRHGRQPGQVFADFVYRPVRDADGAVAGVLLYAADVTAHVRDRRRLETLAEQLAATEERYRSLFETMPQGVIRFGADGSFIGANPAALHILGLEAPAVFTCPLPSTRAPLPQARSP